MTGWSGLSSLILLARENRTSARFELQETATKAMTSASRRNEACWNEPRSRRSNKRLATREPEFMRLVAQQVLSLILALLGGVAGLAAAEAPPTEYQLKAAFLFNFAKFVDWPTEAFSARDSPLVIGVLGENPFGQGLEETIRNKSVGGHPLSVKATNSLAEARKCHILYISPSETGRLHQVLDSVRDSNVLTVGETEQFLDSGGIINFVIQGQKIRFEINAGAAKRAGLKVSSKLLSLSARARTN